jgi:hypothetical protein
VQKEIYITTMPDNFKGTVSQKMQMVYYNLAKENQNTINAVKVSLSNSSLMPIIVF